MLLVNSVVFTCVACQVYCGGKQETKHGDFFSVGGIILCPSQHFAVSVNIYIWYSGLFKSVSDYIYFNLLLFSLRNNISLKLIVNTEYEIRMDSNTLRTIPQTTHSHPTQKNNKHSPHLRLTTSHHSILTALIIHGFRSNHLEPSQRYIHDEYCTPGPLFAT